MIKSELLDVLKKRNVRDYTYAIMFFLVSTFFAFFVIRPVLSIAISIQRQAEDLKEINALYEKNITKALELQSQLEELRPRKYVLDEALPSQPHVDAIIADIKNAASESGVTISSVSIGSIDLKSNPTEKKPNEATNDNPMIEASISVSAPFTEIDRFLRAIVQQRRVKSLHNMAMTVGKAKTENIVITLDLELESYYVAEK